MMMEKKTLIAQLRSTLTQSNKIAAWSQKTTYKSIYKNWKLKWKRDQYGYSD